MTTPITPIGPSAFFTRLQAVSVFGASSCVSFESESGFMVQPLGKITPRGQLIAELFGKARLQMRREFLAPAAAGSGA